MATTIFLVNPREGAVTPPGYLLDTYSAAAAYSLRQLKTGVTSVVRVRRSSGNKESDFTATEITDGTLTGFCGGGDGFVVTWYDQSGNGYNQNQTSATSQPKIVSSGSLLTLNSVGAIQFDGSNDYLTRGTILTELHSVPFSVWGVANNEGNNSNGQVYSNRLPSGSNVGTFMRPDRTTNRRLFNIDTGATNNEYNYLSTDNTNSQRLLSFIIDNSSNGEAFLNGTSQETLTLTGTLSTGGNFDIGRQSLGTVYHNGYIQELIIWNSDESSNRTDIELDINTHYGIY